MQNFVKKEIPSEKRIKFPPVNENWMKFNMNLNVGMEFLVLESRRRRGKKKEKEPSTYILESQNTEIIA